MKIALISNRIASWSLILIGIGHTVTYLIVPTTSEQNDFILKMKNFTIHMLGTETNLFSFHQGYSIMMGLLLFGYGLLNLLILKNNQQSNLPSNILVLNILISLASVLLSLKFFFIVPVIFTSISFLGFLIAISTKNKKI